MRVAVSSKKSCRSSLEPFNFSFFHVTGWGIYLDYRDFEWFALEMNRAHSVVFEIAPKYCISDSSVKQHDESTLQPSWKFMETEYTKNGLQSSCYWVESLESRALFIWFILLTRDAWSNRQVWPSCAKWSGAKFGLCVQNEVGPRLTEFCQENSLVIANTLLQQHKRQLYTWTSLDTQYRNQIDYIFCSKRWGISIQSPKTRLGADYGSDHELLIAKFRLKLKKVGETTRPLRYVLNQIP